MSLYPSPPSAAQAWYVSRSDMSATTSSPNTARKPLVDLHVLVVDDEEDARDLVATILESSGARVTQAESVVAALQALDENDISLVVSDIGMPGEDGYSFMRKVRASSQESIRTVPALALSAFARDEDRARALTAGFLEHVAKPVDMRRLVELVASLARR